MYNYKSKMPKLHKSVDDVKAYAKHLLKINKVTAVQ